MQVRIHKPVKSAMQSGKKIERWVLEFLPSDKSLYKESYMGRTSSSDMNSEIKMYFDDMKSAEEYAIAHNYNYEIIMPAKKKLQKKSYIDNFI